MSQDAINPPVDRQRDDFRTKRQQNSFKSKREREKGVSGKDPRSGGRQGVGRSRGILRSARGSLSMTRLLFSSRGSGSGLCGAGWARDQEESPGPRVAAIRHTYKRASFRHRFLPRSSRIAIPLYSGLVFSEY